jgi:hypothetical protein
VPSNGGFPSATNLIWKTRSSSRLTCPKEFIHLTGFLEQKRATGEGVALLPAAKVLNHIILNKPCCGPSQLWTSRCSLVLGWEFGAHSHLAKPVAIRKPLAIAFACHCVQVQPELER